MSIFAIPSVIVWARLLALSRASLPRVPVLVTTNVRTAVSGSASIDAVAETETFRPSAFAGSSAKARVEPSTGLSNNVSKIGDDKVRHMRQLPIRIGQIRSSEERDIRIASDSFRAIERAGHDTVSKRGPI